jgi:hypothetical protein
MHNWTSHPLQLSFNYELLIMHYELFFCFHPKRFDIKLFTIGVEHFEHKLVFRDL